MKRTSKHRGKHQHRFSDNPEERLFAAAWQAFCEKGNLDYLLSNNGRSSPVSDNDAKVAATVIQWLGSPIGRAFLENLGYIKK